MIIRNLINKSYNNRIRVVEIMKKCGVAHVGGALSSLDILTVLYGEILKHNPKDPKWENRDIFILSAAHKAIALYTVLQSEGYFDEKILWTYNQMGTKIPTHPNNELPGIEFALGSLGHGLSVAGGIAIVLKRETSNRKVYVLLGEGEMAEGSVWEAIMSAAKYRLDNLIAIIDVNGLQAEGYTKEVMPIEPFEDKLASFGWITKKINGNDIKQIYIALSSAPYRKDQPTCIIANTIKGKGIYFAESKIEYHNWVPNEKSCDEAIISIEKNRKKELEKVGK